MTTFLNIFAIIGGLALFIFGMNLMTTGLREAAGSGLRRLLFSAGRNRLSGLTFGTALGTLVHSSATTVMIVGLINAGLFPLAGALPPIIGANIGTTFSMQAISFKLSAYCYVAIAFGMVMHLLKSRPRLSQAGLALLGFGLLFLGMETMSEAVYPFRAQLQPVLSAVDGATWRGMFLGIALSAGLTAVWQSSGATVGMCFAFADAGVFTRLEQTFPIVLGAHIGTCATALLGSIGTNIEARRSAFLHLAFNLFNVAAAVAASALLLDIIPRTSTDLTRQTANLHTAVILTAGLLALPFSRLFTRTVSALVRSRKPPPTPSFLDDSLIEKPEQALQAALSELQRIARVCRRNFRLAAKVMMFSFEPNTVQTIKENEKIVNQIKRAMREYLSQLTEHYLSQRQLMLIEHIDRCMSDLERIADHVDEICDLSLARGAAADALLEGSLLKELQALYEDADGVLELVIESLHPQQTNFQQSAARILEARDAFNRQQTNLRVLHAKMVAAHEIAPMAAVFFARYVSALICIVKHAKSIAHAEQQPEFFIKRRKLDRAAVAAPKHQAPPLVDGHDFLDKLQSEDYL